MQKPKLKSQLVHKFGKKVRDARMERGLSQEDLAAKAKLHRTFISLI